MTETVLGEFPPGKSPPENSDPSNSPLENSPRKISSLKIPTWNIPTHFTNFLSSLNTSPMNGGRVYMCILPGRYLQNGFEFSHEILAILIKCS